MEPLEDRLLNECRQIAADVLHNYDKAELIDEVWTSEEREKLAKAYFDEAHWTLSHVKEAGYDPELVVRALSYMGGMAVPPMGERTDWFRETLSTLIFIACPYLGTKPEGEPFFDDLRRGMQDAEDFTREQQRGEA
jgi:hypothetical protein